MGLPVIGYRIPPAMAPRATIIVSLWLPHAVLIPIYWNLARPVRLPLPIIIPGVNTSAHRFGGFGLSEMTHGGTS